MFNLITMPFAYIMRLIYSFVQNYGLTVILFTILAKLALWPLNAKSQKSMAAMQKIQPQLAKLQEKYKNDKDKLGIETMNLYKEHNINPMGGCLPMLIQFPLIIAIYNVIIKPITYLMNVDMSVSEIITLLQKNGFGEALSATSQQIQVYAAVVESGLENMINGFKTINFNFLGLDLSQVPQAHLGEWTTNFIWIIPVLSLLSAFAMSKLSSSVNNTGSAANEQAQQTQKTMLLLMPLMSGYFTLILPAGVGLYWIASNLFQMVQQTVTSAMLKREMASDEPIEDAIDVKIKKTKKKKKK